jgi:hypothetical protein
MACCCPPSCSRNVSRSGICREASASFDPQPASDLGRSARALGLWSPVESAEPSLSEGGDVLIGDQSSPWTFVDGRDRSVDVATAVVAITQASYRKSRYWPEWRMVRRERVLDWLPRARPRFPAAALFISKIGGTGYRVCGFRKKALSCQSRTCCRVFECSE